MSKLGLGTSHQQRQLIIEALNLNQLRNLVPFTQPEISHALQNNNYELELSSNSEWLPAHNALTLILAQNYLPKADHRHWCLKDTIALLKTVALYYAFDY